MSRRRNQFCSINGCVNFIGTKSTEFTFFRYIDEKITKIICNRSQSIQIKIFCSILFLQGCQNPYKSEINGQKNYQSIKKCIVQRVICSYVIYIFRRAPSLKKENFFPVQYPQFSRPKTRELIDFHINYWHIFHDLKML